MDVAPSGQREAPFHVLLDGSCTLQVDNTLLALRPGDVVLIPSGSPHHVVTAGNGPTGGTVETTGDAFVTTRSAFDDTPVIDLFCGHYSFGAGAGAVLLETLPDPVHVSFGTSVESDALQMLSAMMRSEAQGEADGSAAILSALCTVLLAMVLRASSAARPGVTLWTATSDERIAAAVEVVLQDPGAAWSVERLSQVSAMSRATFLRRFARSTGMTVGGFLARVRLMSAAELLLTTDLTVAAVAARVGYRSESAFSRVFRATVGTTPARFRRTAA